MMKKRLLFIPAIMIISLGVLTLAGCNNNHVSPEEKAEWIVQKISKTINLSQDQIVKLEDVKIEIMKHRKEHQATKVATMDSLIAEIKKTTINQEVIMAMFNQHKMRIEQVVPLIIEKFVIFHESLTAEQKAKAVTVLEKFRKLHHNQAG